MSYINLNPDKNFDEIYYFKRLLFTVINIEEM